MNADEGVLSQQYKVNNNATSMTSVTVNQQEKVSFVSCFSPKFELQGWIPRSIGESKPRGGLRSSYLFVDINYMDFFKQSSIRADTCESRLLQPFLFVLDEM